MYIDDITLHPSCLYRMGAMGDVDNAHRSHTGDLACFHAVRSVGE